MDEQEDGLGYRGSSVTKHKLIQAKIKFLTADKPQLLVWAFQGL